MRRLLWLLWGVACACEPGECNLTTVPTPQMDFVLEEVDPDTGDTTEVAVALPIDTLFAVGGGGLATPDSTITSADLPLSAERTTVTYVFVRSDTLVTDTVQLGYRPEISFISHECGFAALYDSLRVLRTTFDSVVVVQPRVSTVNETNVKVYF